MRRVLVTGGRGFIGSHLVDALVAEGLDVVVVDNLTSPVRWPVPKGVEFVFGDATDVELLTSVGDVDYVFALAGPGSTRDFWKAPLDTWKTNALGAAVAATVARQRRCGVFYASSCLAYGMNYRKLIREVEPSIIDMASKKALYELGKVCGEAILNEYRQDVPVHVARFFLVYGPRMGTNGHMMGEFVWRAMNNEPMVVFGDGSHVQAPVYVTDVVDAMLRMMKRPYSLPVVNIGGQEALSVMRAAQRVAAVLGSRSAILTGHPLPPGDPAARVPDLTLAREELGWTPKVGFEEGVRRLAAFFGEYGPGPYGGERTTDA